MTTEQKAKAYDEAIERASKLRVQNPFDTVSQMMEHVFPELCESEDERIRKSIIGFLKTIASLKDGKTVSNEDFDSKELINWTAWIEKQGKRSNANCLLSWSEIDEKMFQSLEGILKDYWAKAEREKNEIKIREASDVSYFLKTIQKSPLCWIKCSDGLPNKDGTYLVVTDGAHNDVYDLARYDSIDGWHKASEIIYWMPIPQLNNKSIIEQKSAEWSEEDEEMFEYTISLLNYNLGCRKWLKSLKERYTWKPSDEQMNAFEQVYDWYNNNFAPSETLTSLYKDLEKLKGE